MRVRFRAPAKLNLGLRVVGRRPDGYHLLESLFVPLEYADRIELEIDAGDDIRLHVSGEDAVPRGADNLVTRAAGAYLKALGAPRHIEIRLEKEIPTAAGLGGGSSDAGRVLAKLAELLPGVPGDEVRDIALGLGADVPFFLEPRPAWVSGIGERIEPLGGVPGLPCVLAHPGEALSTGPVFKAFAESSGPRITLTEEIRDSRLWAGGALCELGYGRFSQTLSRRLEKLLTNDLEATASRLCPAISRLRDKLADAGASVLGMSGSGPTMFALFGSPEESRDFGERLTSKLEGGERCWVTQTLPSS